jgi:hypothetical protein
MRGGQMMILRKGISILPRSSSLHSHGLFSFCLDRLLCVQNIDLWHIPYSVYYRASCFSKAIPPYLAG